MDDFEMDTTVTVADTEERICRASLNVTPEGEWTLYINFDETAVSQWNLLRKATR
jgi:hypothetical protein